jgi:phenylpropionate dioxygenase-like ring-hydroxylating dioxygenase large terminal subunit
MNMAELFEMLDVAAAADRFGRGPVDARPYFDEEWFKDEVAAIFMRSWLHVGHVCELPTSGSFVRRDIEFARTSLLIVRGKDGQVRSFYNVCTHRGSQLTHELAGRRSHFSCPYHMWTFGTDGQLISAPDFDRFHVSKAECALKEVNTQVLAGMIFIHLGPTPKESVRDQFGNLADAMEQMPMARATDFTEWRYTIEANWKVNFDNFQENYHLRFIHPRTGEQIIGPDNPMGYATHYGFSGPHRSQRLWKNPSPPPLPEALKLAGTRAAQLPHPRAEAFQKSDMKLFPCLHIVWLSPDTQFSHTVTPISANRTRGSVRMYWMNKPENATRAFARELAAMSLRDVLSEDRNAVEGAQCGIGSGVLDRINLQDHEVLLRHLYQQVEQRVRAWRSEKAQTGVAQ